MAPIRYPRRVHRTFALIVLRRTFINARAVLTDYQPYTNIAAHTENELKMAKVPTLKTKLKRLVGFKEMTFSGEVPTTGAAGSLVAQLLFELSKIRGVRNITKKLKRVGD